MLLKSFYDVNSSFTRLELVDNLNSMYIDSVKLIENKAPQHLNRNVHCVQQFNSNTVLSIIDCLIKSGLLVLLNSSESIRVFCHFSFITRLSPQVI